MAKAKNTFAKKLRGNAQLVIAILLLIGCFVFMGFHLHEASKSLSVLKSADPRWVALAFAMQVLTYFCSGGIFYEILRAAKLRVPLRRLAELAVERLSVNQIAPAAGFSGHVYIFMIFRRHNVPRGVAAEALFLDTLSFHMAYAISTVLALGIVLGLRAGSLIIVGGLIAYLFVTAAVLGSIFWIFAYTERELPKWLTRWSILREFARSLKAARPERIQAPWVLSITTFYELLVFTLDGATLWAIMHIIGVPLPLMVCFVVFILASIAASVSLLPGGIGSFEAASVLALRWFNVDLGTALTATLLLRALTLWLPLIPGSILAAKYVVKGGELESAERVYA